MSLLLPLIPLLAQVGPFSAPGALRGTPPEQAVVRPARPAARAAPVPQARSSQGQACLARVDDDPEAAADQAGAWLAADGAHAAEANLCMGLAQSRLEDWEAATGAFLAARDAAGADRMMRARLGAMAGNAALAGGAHAAALAALEGAGADLAGLADPALATAIALDRARALVALDRAGEAGAALALARATGPDNHEAWLLSATLSRRQGKLAEAQAQILRAAELMPVDPAIGLEAGVIAVLSGHDEAARKSWASVIAAAPGSAEAATAKGYVAQLGGGSAVPAAPAPATVRSEGR